MPGPAMAADLAARGEQALGRGHLPTASWALLAAAEYYAKALMFVDGLADQSVLLPTFRQGPGLLGEGGRRLGGPVRPGAGAV